MVLRAQRTMTATPVYAKPVSMDIVCWKTAGKTVPMPLTVTKVNAKSATTARTQRRVVQCKQLAACSEQFVWFAGNFSLSILRMKAEKFKPILCSHDFQPERRTESSVGLVVGQSDRHPAACHRRFNEPDDR